MIRYIQIEDSNKIDAEITFKSIKKGNQIYMALENGEKPLNKRVLKSTKENSLDFLIGKTNPSEDDYSEFSERLIHKDDEIDHLVHRFQMDFIFFEPRFFINVSPSLFVEGDLAGDDFRNHGKNLSLVLSCLDRVPVNRHVLELAWDFRYKKVELLVLQKVFRRVHDA